MVNKENYEEYMLLYADGELSDAEVNALLAFVEAHPELSSELEAYSATRLVPDTTIVYAHKEQLMKSPGGGRTIALGKWWMYAAAACVLLFAVMFFRNNDTNTLDSTSVAINEQPKTNSNTKPASDTAKEDIHSNPANSTNHENAIAREENTKPRSTNATKKKVPIINQPIQLNDVQVAKKEEPKQTPQPETKPLPVLQPKAEQPVLAQTETKTAASEEPLAIATTQGTMPEPKDKMNWLPLDKNKKESISALAEVVNEKLDKLKEVKKSINDSEVKFRIGNRDLLIVRL